MMHTTVATDHVSYSPEKYMVLSKCALNYWMITNTSLHRETNVKTYLPRDAKVTAVYDAALNCLTSEPLQKYFLYP